MGDRFLCLVKTRCFSFSSSHIPSLTSRPFLHHNHLRARPPLRFPKPNPSTTLPLSSSSSQLELISTTECSDGSVVFRFGDASEKAAFDELNTRLEAELVAESNVEGSEVDASPASSPDENAVFDLVTADETESSVVSSGNSTPSTSLQDVSTEGGAHTRDVSGASAPRRLELHTVEGSEGYLSTISEDEMIEGEAHRRDSTGASTPLECMQGSEECLSTKSDDDLTEGKEDGPDVVEASTPSPVELHTSEDFEDYPATKSDDDLTEGKEDGPDVVGASTPRYTSEGFEGYPSTKSKEEFTEGKEDRTVVIRASTPTPVELHSSAGSEGDSSTKSEDELTQGKEDRTDVVGASTPMPAELVTTEGSEGCPFAKSEDEVTESKEHEIDITGASIPMPVELHTFEGSEGYPSTKSEEKVIQGKEERTDATEASSPRTVELDTIESSDGYPSTKLEDKFTEGRAHRRDVTGGSTDRTEDMHTVEVAEKNVSINSEDGFANDKIHERDASGELVPMIMELVSVEGPKGSPLTKSEDESTEAIEQRDVSGASTPITVELHTVEGGKGNASTKLIDKNAEGKLESTDVLEAAIPRTMEMHTVKRAEDTPSKRTEDLAVNAHRRNVLRASTSGIVELRTVEGAEGEDISEPLLLQSTGAALLPHPSKALTGGEDACFVALGNWLGVADGVSQWSLQGTSPGQYARELMENCERTLFNCEGAPLTKPEDVLVRGVTQTKCPGSSTALVAFFDGQSLHVANIGNSGFIIIRNGAVFKRSSPMIHGFNFPLQVVRGVDPLELIERYYIDLDDGDIIITATDGLFDNLYEQEIALIVTKSLQRRMRLQDIAEFLATSALEVGQSSSRRSPFADAVEASGYVGYTGGKLDDVTVIVSHVQKKSSC